jgi:hypothetical protein
VISKLRVHKLLEIKLLQNALYGRLAVDGTLAMEAARGFNLHLAGARKLALASLRDREGVEESRNFERA